MRSRPSRGSFFASGPLSGDHRIALLRRALDRGDRKSDRASHRHGQDAHRPRTPSATPCPCGGPTDMNFRAGGADSQFLSADELAVEAELQDYAARVATMPSAAFADRVVAA